MNKGCRNCKHFYDSTESVFPVGKLTYCTNKTLAGCKGKLLTEEFNPNKNHDCKEYNEVGLCGKIANSFMEAFI